MATFLTKSKANITEKGMAKVYFTCHPDDFEPYFERICADIFNTHNCTFFYTQDMSQPIEEGDLHTGLGRCDLFVVPVTFKLLNFPNRAMDFDIPFALQEHIPILPLMMEPGLDNLYAQPDKFGELQYLDPFSRDDTAIPYGEKLKKYLDTVLISDELANRIRAAFDAYIFLSYRKKDRRYANELMRLIHSYPECRDIAIWFDEFLTPGESFKDSIQKILNDSKLFALLVTPNLLEMPDGKPNFVMGEEYPAAQRAGIPILPAEMEDTDKAALYTHFEGFPDCVDPRHSADFRAHLLETAQQLAIRSNNTPEHNYLIGLAYMEGIDVEVDRARGLQLITEAAEAGLCEAMHKLFQMYYNGICVKINYSEALKWAQALVTHSAEKNGAEDAETLEYRILVSQTYKELGNYHAACTEWEKIYELCRKIYGEESPDTIFAMEQLACAYHEKPALRQAAELLERAHQLRCKVFGENHPETIASLLALAAIYPGTLEKGFATTKKAYEQIRALYGEEHPETISALTYLASSYLSLDDYENAAAIYEQVYDYHCSTLGEDHRQVLSVLHALAFTYEQLEDYSKAFVTAEKVYTGYYNLLGEEHPETISALLALATACENLGELHTARNHAQRACDICRRIFGKDHPDTMMAELTLMTIDLQIDDED